MRRPRRKHKCRHCQMFFDPDPRSAGRQRYCSKPECRKASKTASQLKWRDKPANRDYFKGPDHVQRVRQWRQAHPGYWRPQAAKASHALQDEFTPKANENQSLENDLEQHALQDTWFVQPTVWVGLISHLTGMTLQDDIATAARRWQQLGHDILSGSSLHLGDTFHDQTSPLYGQAATPANSVQLGGSARPVLRHALVRDRRIDLLSHQACALYLFLITVADAQGLSYFAERSLCQRLAMAEVHLRQARELLMQQGLIAYKPPLYQVLDLGEPQPPAPEPPDASDEAVDIEAVFKRIWEVLS